MGKLPGRLILCLQVDVAIHVKNMAMSMASDINKPEIKSREHGVGVPPLPQYL